MFFVYHFYVIFRHSLLIKRKEKFAVKKIELWVTLKSNRQNLGVFLSLLLSRIFLLSTKIAYIYIYIVLFR